MNKTTVSEVIPGRTVQSQRNALLFLGTNSAILSVILEHVSLMAWIAMEWPLEMILQKDLVNAMLFTKDIALLTTATDTVTKDVTTRSVDGMV